MRDYLKYKFLLSFYLIIGIIPLFGVAQFAPSAGVQGTTAIHKDSSVFVNWANHCRVFLGPENIQNSTSPTVSAGDSSMAVGIPGNGIVSLGDGGSAILTFERPIRNGTGWDFAIFENSFSDTFLELGLVAVSSDGFNYFQFESTSLTQDTFQVDAFGSINPEMLNNLAGKYRATFGTPFDLEELSMEPDLDINHITHVKITDVIGSIDPTVGTYDYLGNIINDPFPTEFPSSGFDLDALGVIYEQPLTILESKSVKNINNLIIENGFLSCYLNAFDRQEIDVSVIDFYGKKTCEYKRVIYEGINPIKINLSDLKNGIYILNISTNDSNYSQKFLNIK